MPITIEEVVAVDENQLSIGWVAAMHTFSFTNCTLTLSCWKSKLKWWILIFHAWHVRGATICSIFFSLSPKIQIHIFLYSMFITQCLPLIREHKGNTILSTFRHINFHLCFNFWPIFFAFFQSQLDSCDMKMKNSLEGIVIKWAFQIDEVLKESSHSLFDKNNHPTPMAEVRFWENRRKNIMNLYEQLKDERVKKIGSILEKIQSVYYKTFSQTFKNVVTALHEADDITLWFKPLVCIEFFDQSSQR